MSRTIEVPKLTAQLESAVVAIALQEEGDEIEPARVEIRGFLRTPVETTSGGKRRRLNELAPEVAHHQQVRKTS